MRPENDKSYYTCYGGDQANLHPPLWIGYLGNHYQSLEEIEITETEPTMATSSDVNERNCEIADEEVTLSAEEGFEEETLSVSDPDPSYYERDNDSLFKPPTPPEQPLKCVVISGEDSDTATIVSLSPNVSPSLSPASSDWSPGGNNIEVGLNEGRLASLRPHWLRPSQGSVGADSEGVGTEGTGTESLVTEGAETERAETERAGKVRVVTERAGTEGGKKRKRTTGETNLPKSKKCRAIHGQDNKDLWCKPCKNSKKCTKYS